MNLKDLLFATQMTLRDYFAAHAPLPVDTLPIEEHCAWRYKYADAMIAARGGK